MEALSDYHFIDGDYSILAKKSSDLIIDSEFCLSLFWKNKGLGTCGIDLGLEDYYCDSPFVVDDDISRIMDICDGKYIVTQMQGSKGTGELRNGINFQRKLLHSWDDVMQEQDLSIDFYLPAALNYWWLLFIRDDVPYKPPCMNVLKMNYNYTAKRNGFVFNDDLGLFVRK